jgi:hypothetical protein
MEIGHRNPHHAPYSLIDSCAGEVRTVRQCCRSDRLGLTDIFDFNTGGATHSVCFTVEGGYGYSNQHRTNAQPR